LRNLDEGRVGDSDCDTLHFLESERLMEAVMSNCQVCERLWERL
jgi:hypothetical protein